MALNKAQLMPPPEGPGVYGAIKAGVKTEIIDGVVNFENHTPGFVSKVITTTPESITIDPVSGVGVVTINWQRPASPIYAAGEVDDDFPAGTKMAFYQASAPTGWTSSGVSDATLRVVSGSGGGTGGSQGFTSVHTSYNFTGTVSATASASGNTGDFNAVPSGQVNYNISSQATTLGTGEMARHTHAAVISTNIGGSWCFWNTGGGCNLRIGDIRYKNSGGNQSHSHSLSGFFRLDDGGGGNHNHSFNVSGTASGSQQNGGSFNFSVKYADLILCTKQ